MGHDSLQSSSLSKEEQFLDTVFKEVRNFASGDVQNSLLLFPALLKRERFLTHKVVEENFENLCSFSLGKNDLRRTAVCLKSRLIHALTSRQCNHEGVHHLALTLCRQQGLPVDFLSYRMKKAATNKTETALPPRAARRQRRPDMQLYVPRGRNLEPPQRAASSCAQEDRIGKHDDDQTRWNTEVKGPRPSTGEALSSQNHAAQCLSTTQTEHFDRRSTASVPAGRSRNAPKQQTTLLPGGLPEPSTDSTGCVGDHRLSKSPQPYTEAAECSEYGHILEIYNFPPEFETKDVVSGLSCSRDQFNIKWVDDTHVLAVFSTPFAATEALSLQTPLMKMRHISEASKQSKLKVKRCAEFLQPFKPRPQTSASVARRLVSGALGLRVQVEPEQRRRELQMLREAKGKSCDLAAVLDPMVFEPTAITLDHA
ncbi:hypothetical protein HPB47_023575 [Ixodes persulcatus]|uniref:Uncharacterized protein n=1 Tax=Ixodes persulcatus TaxID=34615 RepID=A0AC60Q6L3_IXOPE|nr:hypothetical protein HPB47_023575 [Ixodes persulcatus]